jgi:hypothetical protein
MDKIILKTDEFEVINVGKTQYTIKLKQSSVKLVNSIIKAKIITGSVTDENYQLIKFKAESVKSLKQFMENSKSKIGREGLIVPDIAKMIRSLGKQLEYLLENEFSTIIGYSPENIIVINEERFAFISSEFIADFDEVTELAMISCPFNTNDFFFSPELLSINEIPSYIHYKTSYFSFACLILFSITGDDEFYKEFLTHKQPQKILEILNNHPIKNTRIYWLLSRCLVEKVNNRSIICL